MKSLLLLFLAFTTACSGQPQENSATGSLKPIRVQLNWKNQFEFAAFYAAIEKGFYRSEGLEVTLSEGGPGIDPVEVVLSGKADFGIANSSLVVEHAQGKPVVALAAMMQHSAFALLARRDRGIDNITDLDGKRISCAAHACDEIRAYLRASGLHDDRIRYQPMRISDIDRELEDNDATDIFTTNQGFNVLGREHQFVMFLPRSGGVDLYGDILFTSQNQVTTRRETVAAFRAATTRGLHYALTHQDELVDLILARFNTQGKTRAHLAYEAKKLYDLIRPDLVDPGYMSLGRWRHVRDIYAGLGMVPADYPVENMIFRPDEASWPAWLLWATGGLGFAFALTTTLALYLRRINRQLQYEAHERALAEATLKTREESFRRFVEQANSLVAHEVRTPLSVLRVHLDVLDLKKTEDITCAANLGAMKQALNRLHQLLEKNLRQVFDSASTFNQQQSIDLRASLSRLIANHAELNNDSRVVELAAGPSPVVCMTQEMLETVVYNLLDNARKYSPTGSKITVMVGQEGTDAVIEVANVSVLPLPDDPQRLFAKHVRGADDESRPGTGVGLYLVRLIAEAHRGEARILITPPDGFRVRLRLPCQTDATLRNNAFHA